MTLHELSQLHWLEKEIREYESRLAELRRRAYDIKSQNIDGMPHGKSECDMLTERVSDIDELEKLIEAKKHQCVLQRLKLESYINTIPDSQTRLIFRYRFVKCLTWSAVARRIGGNNTGDSVRKRVKRYLSNF